MNLKRLLHDKKSSIAEKWCAVVLESYPEESRNFLRRQKDRFANPIGATIFEGIGSIYDELLSEADSKKISLFLDNIIRVRAVQNLSPSQAVGFIFELKRIIAEELSNELQDKGLFAEWRSFEPKIDGLALLCFDIYTECRQRLFDIRINEVKNQSSRLLKMAGLVYEIPDTDGELDEKGRITNNSKQK